MSRQYTVTYHYEGKTRTLHLYQEQLDTLLSFGDTYPLNNKKPNLIKCEWSGGSDGRLWWGNTPLETDRGEALLLAGISHVVTASHYQ